LRHHIDFRIWKLESSVQYAKAVVPLFDARFILVYSVSSTIIRSSWDDEIVLFSNANNNININNAFATKI